MLPLPIPPPSPLPSRRLRRLLPFLLSPFCTYLFCLGGAALFECLTRPWSNPVIPSPYLLFYGLATFLCAMRGYLWGLAASLSWYFGVFLVQWSWFHNYSQPHDLTQLLRFCLHLTVPVLFSWPFAQRRRAEREKARAEEQRRELIRVFSSSIAHEFNNQLMVILGNLHLLEAVAAKADRQAWQDAVTAAERLAGAVGRIQHFGRLGYVSPELLEISEFLAESAKKERVFWGGRAGG